MQPPEPLPACHRRQVRATLRTSAYATPATWTEQEHRWTRQRGCSSRRTGAISALDREYPAGAGGRSMRRTMAYLAVVGFVLSAPAWAQKHGGVLTIPHIDSPPSPSIHEEATASVVIPFMPMFNNLVIFDQHIPQHSLDTIRPELASAWKWSTTGTDLTFTLRPGVKWHDGKPFTSADVKCTWDMVSGLAPGKIRKSPRQTGFTNLTEITVSGDLEATFH